MALGGAGGTADAVPAGTAAQQDHHVPGCGPLPADIFRRGRAHHHTALQVFGHISGVIDLRHVAGGKADLVAVGGIAGGGSLGNPALGQLPGQSLVYRDAGIAAAGKPHGLMYIGPPGQGSRMHPPMQVAAPPKGSISVGWLWVSF